jgi:HPt (histidine-containing phosphotransfer) domain-containing protein
MKQNPSILNTEIVLNRLNGDQFLFDALYRIYLKQIRNYMQEFEKSLRKGDFQQIAAISHSLKSCFQAIGAELCDKTNQLLFNAIVTGTLEKVPQLFITLSHELDRLFLSLSEKGLDEYSD